MVHTIMNENYYNTKRLLHFNMVELNCYAVTFCIPKDYNFLFFNNINFNMNGLLLTNISKKVKGFNEYIKT